ncbi:MAG: acyl carrier protein [Streptosporangiaceae bacterium]
MTSEEVLSQLRPMLAGVTGRPEAAGITRQTPLFGPEVGLDSLTGTLLLVEIQQRFGVDVAAEDLNLDSLATLATLAQFLAEHA